jgi:hypothetical protein
MQGKNFRFALPLAVIDWVGEADSSLLETRYCGRSFLELRKGFHIF